MAIYHTYRVSRVTKCDCSAYQFPHSWGTGKCTSSIIDNPPEFKSPKRGLSGKIEKILSAYSSSENELICELISELRGT